MLRREEIDTLLEGLERGVSAPEPGSEPEGEQGVRRIELASQERIIRGRQPGLELVFDRFARNLRSVLEKHVGKACVVTPATIEQEKFGRFARRLTLPSSMHLFRLPPLIGQAVMVCSVSLVDALTDASFGGSGMPRTRKPAVREFTAIENRLVTKFVLLALDELKDAWSVVQPLNCVYVRAEFNPLGLSIAAASDNAVTASFVVTIGGQDTELQICIPYPMLERIREKLSAGIQAPQVEDRGSSRARMHANLLSTTVNLSVELVRGKIQVRDLLTLKVGETLLLETPANASALVRVEGVGKFNAIIGKKNGSKAVEILLPKQQAKP